MPHGLTEADVREVTQAFQSAVNDSAETQTVYLRYLTGRTEKPSGRPVNAGTPHTDGPYRARVTEISEAAPYVLKGIAANLGGADFDLFLRGKAIFEFVTDLDLESKEDPRFYVKAEGEYLVYEPFKVDDALVCNRDLIGENLVTYYVLAKLYGKEASL